MNTNNNKRERERVNFSLPPLFACLPSLPPVHVHMSGEGGDLVLLLSLSFFPPPLSLLTLPLSLAQQECKLSYRGW